MKTMTKTLILAGLAALTAGSVTLSGRASEAPSSVKILGENKGASFDVGTKKAVAFASVRFSSNVAAGTTAQLDTSDGAALSLSCAQNASNLVVESIDRVAYTPVRATN